MNALKALIKWGLFAIVLAFVVYALGVQFKQIDWTTVHFQPFPLVLAVVCLLLVPPVQLISYRTLLGAYAHAPSWKVMAAVAWVPPLGKYVPGKVASLVGAVYILRRFDIPAAIALSVVLAMDGLAVMSGLITGAPLLWWFNPNGIIPAIVVVLAGVICLHPAIFSRLLNFVLIRLKRAPLDHVPDLKHYVIPVICAFSQWLLAGVALWLIARSVASVDVRDIPRFISIAGLGYTIGYLALFAPGGLGARELVFQQAMPGLVIPAAMSAVAVVAMRIIQTLTELVAALMGWIILRRIEEHRARTTIGMMSDKIPRDELVAGTRPETQDGGLEVQVENVHKSFDSHPVLKGVNLKFATGEMVAIVGGSGSGKSVLFKHIIGLIRPDEGRVLLADHESPGSPLTDLATLDENGLERIRRHCGVVFQQNALYSGSVHDNVMLALQEVHGQSEDEASDTARSAIDAVGLDVKEVWDQDRDQLSGGMAKRIAIARALALEPVLILYDEPTTGLDPQSASQIYQLIEQTHHRPSAGEHRRTSLIITHDKDLLFRLTPRVALLHDGQVAFDGSYMDFERSDSPIIRPYFELMPTLHYRARRR